MGDFKHITVTPASEDDEVIVAGAVEPEPEQGRERGREPDSEPDSGLVHDPDPVIESVPKPTPSPAPAASPKPVRSQEARGSRGYSVTTLDDLDAERMPIVQRVVVIAAVVCIIGAIVYYFVAMR